MDDESTSSHQIRFFGQLARSAQRQGEDNGVSFSLRGYLAGEDEKSGRRFGFNAAPFRAH